MRYIYGIDKDKVEEVYFSNTETKFFGSDEERERFNAELVINADSEQEALQMRIGITDITMWHLLRTEENK